MARVDDLNPLVAATVIDREEVASGESEEF
jgi:hypothetical protein